MIFFLEWFVLLHLFAHLLRSFLLLKNLIYFYYVVYWFLYLINFFQIYSNFYFFWNYFVGFLNFLQLSSLLNQQFHFQFHVLFHYQYLCLGHYSHRLLHHHPHRRLKYYPHFFFIRKIFFLFFGFFFRNLQFLFLLDRLLNHRWY